MKKFQAQLNEEQRKEIAFEGERELSSIVRDFQQKEISVLCSYHLWEGLDIPQDALTRVIIYDLPFPPHDPLFDARRKHAENPFEEVDLPFMLLRLRQGLGRLIRTSNDSGTVHIPFGRCRTGNERNDCRDFTSRSPNFCQKIINTSCLPFREFSITDSFLYL